MKQILARRGDVYSFFMNINNTCKTFLRTAEQMWRNIWFIKLRRWFLLTYEGFKRYALPRPICRWNEIYYFSFEFTQKALRAVYLTWRSLSFLTTSFLRFHFGSRINFFSNRISAGFIFLKLYGILLEWQFFEFPKLYAILTL